MRCGPALTNICLLRSLIPVINNSFWLSYSACISIIRVSKDLARDLSYSWFSPPIMFQPMERRSGHHEFLPHLQITWTSLYSTVYSLHINTYILFKKMVFFCLIVFNHKAFKGNFVWGSALYPGQCSTEPNIFSLPVGKISAVSSEIST